MTVNVQTMMYHGETPWHGMGKKVEKALTSAEAIKAAGLDWAVTKVPVFCRDLQSHFKQVPNSFGIRRQDNGTTLGIVGKFYNPLQNKDAFKFFDAIVGEKAAMYHTAGALGQGERIWLLAKLPGDVIIKGSDKVEKYLLLMNSHDGTSTVTVKLTPIRVVCQNTLNSALRDGEPSAKLRHTRWLGQRVQCVKQQLDLVHKWYDSFETQANNLASAKCDDKKFHSFVQGLGFGELGSEMGPKTQKMLDDLLKRFDEGRGKDDQKIRGTWWAAYNAVTEFVDHSPLYGRGKTQSDRARSLLYGAGSFLKEKAWAQALVGAKSK